MVCQAASQTRFRALKHENGIVVKVIACFQPLQDCQVIVRFVWMFKADTPWHSSLNSYRPLPDLNHMTTLLENRQQECLPSLSNLGIRKCSVPLALQNSRAQQTNEGKDWLPGFLSDFPALIPSPNLFLEGKKSQFPLGLDGLVVPPNQKGLLIFDQSEDQTRLIYNYFCPTSQIPGTAITKLISIHNEKLPQLDQIDLTKKVASGMSTKSEMHEDTEEINALLESDDESGEDGHDYDNDDVKCDEEDDEVTSTCRSPLETKKGPERQEPSSHDELLEDVASSDGPNKRQKKLNGGYLISSPLSTATSSVNFDCPHKCEYDAKSNCTYGKSRSMKDKIREILVVLESIIPGVKGKDPLLVIDEAIDYLRIAKNKAETLGVSFH